jgi:predicted Zn-dependent protease
MRDGYVCGVGVGMVDLNQLAFEIFGQKVTYFGIGVGFFTVVIPAAAALYKIIDRWQTRKERRLRLLHEYLDNEEKDITARRRPILKGIHLAHSSFSDDKNLDVGAEIDDALALFDSGRPDRAEAILKELLKRIKGNAGLLTRRIDDLKKHERSVKIFLAALAERVGHSDIGLGYISEALLSEPTDSDALKYKGILHLKKGQLDDAAKAFDKLRLNNDGKASLADAHLGLASVHEARGIANFDEAAKAASLAISNLDRLPPAEQDYLTKVSAYQLLGRLYSDPSWAKRDASIAESNYSKALVTLQSLPQESRRVCDWSREISGALWKLKNEKLHGEGSKQSEVGS